MFLEKVQEPPALTHAPTSSVCWVSLSPKYGSCRTATRRSTCSIQGEGDMLLCFFVLSPGEDLRRVILVQKRR
ncbi:hypothetical protein MTO96_003331 [Rhipicephalus appendiculatus]